MGVYTNEQVHLCFSFVRDILVLDNQVTSENYTCLASLTQRFVSAERLFRELLEYNNKLVEHRSIPVREIQDVSSLVLYRRRIPNRVFTR